MEDNKLLEVGDVIYSYQYGSIKDRIVIKRVTEKQAFANDWLKFKREYSGGWLNVIGGQKYGPSYYLETPKYKAEWETIHLKARADRLLRSIRLDLMNNDELQSLIAAITPFKPKSNTK